MMAPHAPRHQQREAAAHRQQQGPGPQATAGQGAPAVVSLQKEINVALDASQPLVSPYNHATTVAKRWTWWC